jgi:hypothetical protein
MNLTTDLHLLSRLRIQGAISHFPTHVLPLYMCMCVWACTLACAWMHAYMRVCAYIHTQNTYIHTYIMHACCIHARTHTHSRAHIPTSPTHTYTHTHACARTHAHTLVYSYIHVKYVGLLSLWHGMSSHCRWRRMPPNINSSCECTE